ANATNDDELRELKVELIDRFGLLPEAAQHLFAVTALKLRAQALGISKIEANAAGCKVRFTADTKVDPYTLVMLVQKQSARYSLSGGSELRMKQETVLPAERLLMVETLLNKLTSSAADKPK